MLATTLALLVLASAPTEIAVPALPLPDNTAAETRSVSCALGESTLTLGFESDTDCGGSAAICVTSQEVKLSRGKSELFDWLRDYDEGGAKLPPLRLRCESNRLMVHFDSGRALALEWDPAHGTLQPAAGFLTETGALWAAAAGDPAARARVDELWQFFQEASFNVADPSRTVVELLEARGAIARSDFRRADAILNVLPASPGREGLRKDLSARREAIPYRFVDGAKIGQVTAQKPTTGDEDDAPPAAFWQGARFCVTQQDDSKTMRCYDAVAKRWGKRAPLPDEVPGIPFVPNSGRYDVCTKDQKVCVSCYDFIAALPDSLKIGVGNGRLWLDPGDPSEEDHLVPLSWDRASTLLRKGPGSPFFGGARNNFTPDSEANTAAPVEHPEQTWHPLSAAPNGTAWRAVSVSPDQQFAAAFATTALAAVGPGTWWIFRIAKAL